MAYIISHEAYKEALWDRTNPPKCFTESDDAIALAHNFAIGELQAVQERELEIVTEVNDALCRDVDELRAANEVLNKKLRKQQDTIRRLGNELAEMRDGRAAGIE